MGRRGGGRKRWGRRSVKKAQGPGLVWEGGRLSVGASLQSPFRSRRLGSCNFVLKVGSMLGQESRLCQASPPGT